MTANQIPYDAIDWLQIAIYFLALPVVALFGASLGLLGRTRRGGMLWSINVGLLGGAIACVIIAGGISTTGITKSRTFMNYFLTTYRWEMLIITLLATSACALAAGVAWRFLHRPREKQPLNISIGNVMLVQLFAFISMGTFVALRLFMLQSVGEFQLVQQQMQVHGWTVEQGGKLVYLDSSTMSPQQNEEALSAKILQEVAEIPHLEYAYFNLDSAWQVDLSPLLNHPKMHTMAVSCQGLTPAQLQQFANSKLKTLALDGDLTQVDLSPILRAEALENFSLRGFAAKRHVEALANSSVLKSFSVWNAKLSGAERPVRAWPKSIESLAVRSTNLRPVDFASLANHPNLRQLNLFDILMTEQELAFLPTIPNLNSAILIIDANSDTWYEPLSGLRDASLWLDIHSADFSAEDAAHLANFTQIKRLNLDLADHGDDVIDEICKMTSLETLTITSPNLTEASLLRLAQLPNLKQLYFPPHLNTPAIGANFNGIRVKSSLEMTHLEPRAQATRTTAKKPKPAAGTQ
jgi:hypothetical protein